MRLCEVASLRSTSREGLASRSGLEPYAGGGDVAGVAPACGRQVGERKRRPARRVKDGSGGFSISSGKTKETLTVDYIDPPFKLKEGEDLTLRIFIDKSMIEVFANDRQAAVAWHEYDPNNLHVSLFTKGGDLKVEAVTSWKMNSIYTKAAAEQ